MRRALVAILGVVVAIVGCFLLALSGWVYAAFGTEGFASSSLGSLTSSPTSTAIVIDVDATRIRIPVIPVQGRTTIRFESSNGKSLVAGSAPRADADAFTSIREVDIAHREDGSWTLTHVPGLMEAVSSQATPDWMTKGSDLPVTVAPGQSVVIANADGSPDVAVSTSLQYSAPRAPEAALILGICGGVLTLAGLALIFSAIRLMRRRSDENVG